MIVLILGLILFLGTHGLAILRGPRSALQSKLGANGYKLAFTAASLIGLIVTIYGFGVYRATGWTQVWTPPAATRHLALLLNLPIFILFAASGLPGKIKALAKHPQLLAVKIWATAHLLANGDLGGMLLFGGFLAWAVIARISLKRRAGAPVTLPSSTPFGRNDLIAVLIGLVLYAVMVVWLHPLLIGLRVLP